MSFSPSVYLTSQGWSGPGNGLQKGGIKKPVTVAHKTNLKGIGKERDTGYAWWDDVFALVANKGKNGQAKDLKRTSTGIYSHLPPSTSGTATPVDLDTLSSTETPSSSSAFHTDIIGQAKLEATRREFYSKFLRGRTLEGSYDSPAEEQVKPIVLEKQEAQSDDKAELKRLKKERKEERASRRAQKAGQEASSALAQSIAGPSKLPVVPKLKKEKRKKDKARDESLPEDSPAQELSAPTDTGLDVLVVEEKRKKRKRDKEGVAESTQLQDASVAHKLEALRPEADPEAARLAKKLRKEERRQRRAAEQAQ